MLPNMAIRVSRKNMPLPTSGAHIRPAHYYPTKFQPVFRARNRVYCLVNNICYLVKCIFHPVVFSPPLSFDGYMCM
jgi:hypothetical protein